MIDLLSLFCIILKANLPVHSFAIHLATFLHKVQVAFLIKYFEIHYATNTLSSN